MNIKEKAGRIYDILKSMYQNSVCTLEYADDPWKLLVMARLSAQCTDARVNIVCRELFRKIPDVFAMANTPLDVVESIVKPCGLYHSKAKSLCEMSKQLIENFDSKVPNDYESLISLSGVGSKIANLILGDYFGKGGIVADTHCIRISNRLGLCDSENQTRVEKTLSSLIPVEIQSDFCHMTVDFGREICNARKPNCSSCPMAKENLCEHYKLN